MAVAVAAGAPGPAAPPMVNLDVATLGLAAADFNGIMMQQHGDGELFEQNDLHTVVFPHNIDGTHDFKTAVAWNDNEKLQFLAANTEAHFRACAGAGASRTATFTNSLRVAYMRLNVVLSGYMSNLLLPGDYSCTITDCVQLSQAETTALINDFRARPNLQNQIALALPEAVKNTIRRKLPIMIAMVAYHFRARGHHFLEGSANVYDKLWEKCQQDPSQAPLNWVYVARDALHGIYPRHLDNLWATFISDNAVPGAMRLRYTVSPAGSALYSSALKGIKDVSTVFPVFKERMAQEISYLEQIDTIIKEDDHTSRWKFSLNARLYGVNREYLDESQFETLSAVVRGIYEQLADTAPLLGSMALKRNALGAPVVGAVAGKAATLMIERDYPLLLGSSEEKNIT